MALTVEDGSGVVGADSYVSVDDATTYFTGRGLTLSSGTYEPHLLLAMDILNNLTFAGKKADSANPLPWPRENVYDREGLLYAENIIPRPLIDAQLWLARHISQGQNPGVAATPAVKREKVDVLEVEYTSQDGATTRLNIDDLPNVYGPLQHLLSTSSTDRSLMRA